MNKEWYQYIIIGQRISWFFERKFEVLHRFDYIEEPHSFNYMRTRKEYYEFIENNKVKDKYKHITMFRISPEVEDYHYFKIKGLLD